MSTLNNLRTGVKLIGGFVIVALLMLVVAFMGYTNMKTINDGMISIYNDRLVPIRDLGGVQADLFAIRGDIISAAMVPAGAADKAKDITALNTDIDKKITAFKATYLLDTEVAELAVFEPALTEYRAAVAELSAWIAAGNQIDLIKSLSAGGRGTVAGVAVRGSVQKLLDINVNEAANLKKQGDITFTSTSLMLLMIAGGAFLLALAIGFVISGSLTKPLGALVKIATSVSVGNLVRDLDQKVKDSLTLRKDEVGDIAKSFDQVILYMQGMGEVANTIARNDLTVSVTPKSEKDELGVAFVKMIHSLQEAIGMVARNAMQVNAASNELSQAASQAGQATAQIAATIQQVAAGNSQQAESVGQTAKSVEQMARAIDGVAKGAQEQANSIAKASNITAQLNASVQQVAGNAQSVTHDSGEAARAARDGVKTVQETIQGMESIKAKVGLSAAKVQEMGSRSDQIGMIVETIDDIASQTNLLALNAAIEAARAGEHGKGFAVVADEVRKLAERSSAATKEIGGLIRGIQGTVSEAVVAMRESANEVEVGVARANNAGKALESIVTAADAVFQQASQATQAAQKMNLAVNELVESVDSVSAVIEENTAATEEMSAGAHEVTQAIENIAAVSEENSASVEEVSASAEEMSSQVEEVSASASSLEEMAQALQDVVSQFKLTLEKTGYEAAPTRQAPVAARKAPIKPNGNGNGHRPEPAGLGYRKN
jgi:methyl-accepting chemotaxis protein